MEDESNGVGATEETRKALLSLSEAAAKIVPSDLQAFLKEENVCEILLDTFVKSITHRIKFQFCPCLLSGYAAGRVMELLLLP